MKTIYYNGFVHTLTRKDCLWAAEEEVFSAIGVRGRKIDYVGEATEDILKRYPNRVNLQGRHVYPAMTDSHVHLLYTMVLAASSFAVCEITKEGIQPHNLAGAEQKIRAFCRENPNQNILVVNQFILSAMEEKRLPTRQELDEWSDGRSIIVYNIDGHSSSISSALMDQLEIEKEGHDGRFFGEAHEFMQGKVTNLIAASINPAMLAKGIANFSNLCARYGISRVCSLDGNGDVQNDSTTQLLAFLARRLDMDVRLFPQYLETERAAAFFSKQRTPRMGGCGSWELDGSVGSHSAAFYEPFADTGEKGHCYYTEEQIDRQVQAAVKGGIQLTCHAIGEAAIDQIVACYKRALQKDSEKQAATEPMGAASDHGAFREKPLCRIDHFEFPTRNAVEAVKQLPLAITVQPGFSWLDKRFLKSYEQFLPPKKIAQQVPLKELTEAGVCICGSSDSPVQSINPWEQMLGMVEFYLPGQSLTPYQALLTYTVNPARMLGEEAESGTLETGKRADFFVTAMDLCKTAEKEPESMGSFCAEYLIKDGKRYREKKGTMGELAALLFRRPRKI